MYEKDPSCADILTLNTLQPPGNIVFAVGKDAKEIIRLEPNGDIYVKGKLIENDKEVVDGLRDFLQGVKR